MNAKRANLLFLVTILFEAATVAALFVLVRHFHFKMGVMAELLLNQAIVLLPTLLFLAVSRENPVRLIPFRKMKIGTIFLTIVFTILCMPLIVVVNAISLLFVDNAVNDLAVLLAKVSPVIVVLVVGIIGPACEEFVFRGVIYHSYRKSGKYVAAMLLSAFLFGIMHLNFNQMSYAILVGVIGVILIECTGSILSSMIFHMVINTSNALPVVLNPSAYANANQSVEESVNALGMSYHEAIQMAIGVYGVIAVVTTILAIGVLALMISHEGREEAVSELLRKKETSETGVLSWPLFVAIALCLIYMFLTL